MRLFLGMCVLFTLPIWANTQITTQIHDIDHGDNLADEVLVYLTSGKVVKFNVNDTETLEKLNNSLLMKKWLKLDISNDRYIESAVEVAPVLPQVDPEKLKMSHEKSLMSMDPLEGYNASVITPELAKQAFSEMRHPSKEETQCFNRAMVWTYEMRVKHNIYSKKIYIFFTRNYIRRYNFDWWFHVSPMVNMIVDGQIKERTLDKKYSSGPLEIQKWANIFLSDDAKCPYVHTYSDHASYPEAGSCFFQKAPMYYYQPVDLEFLEKFGSVKNRWLESDVRAAYAEAFEIYP